PQLLGSADVIVIVGVAAVDDDIAPLQQGTKLPDHRIDDTRRHHHPHDAWCAQTLHELRESARSLSSLSDDRLERIRGIIVRNALVTTLDQAAHHVRAHTPQSDHADAHNFSSTELPTEAASPLFFSTGSSIEPPDSVGPGR